MRAVATLEAIYARSVPFAEDRACAAELAREAAPIIDALLEAIARGAAADAQAVEHHEALAMVLLLGRRAGALGVTPTAALAIVPALCDALASVGAAIDSPFRAVLTALAMEGYVASREERVIDAAAARAVDTIAMFRVAPNCSALVLRGEHDPEQLREVVERFGRALFAADAKACIVDLAGLQAPSPQHAAEVFGADVAARMLGATCIFSGASPAWIDAATAARVPLEVLAIEPSFELALVRALELAGFSLRRAGGLRALFRR